MAGSAEQLSGEERSLVVTLYIVSVFLPLAVTLFLAVANSRHLPMYRYKVK